jgi:SPP1 gp7 family putative phage head morphogenesis protein
MKRKFLQPIFDRRKYSKAVQRMIEKAMLEYLIDPLKRELKAQGVKLNAKTGPIIAAIESGQISYVDGKFFGSFNAALGKELRAIGARFDKRGKCYSVELSTLPVEVKTALSVASEKNKRKISKIVETIDKIASEGIEPIDVEPALTGVFFDLNKQFDATIGGAGDLAISPKMSKVVEERLATEYIDNVNLTIKGWADESIIDLRQRVVESGTQGYRADRIRDIILAEQGVTQRKAEFIARQETSLLTSKFREERYKDAGIDKYMWQTSEDGRVREDHKILDKSIQSWSRPPIVERATGRRAHPGEDYRCRCIALPVVE